MFRLSCDLQEIDVSKQELLKIMRLLSAIEAVGMMHPSHMPGPISEDILEYVEILEREILK